MSGIDVVARGTNGTPHDAAPGSALARARAAAARQRETHTHDLAVGGSFGENLIVRYGMLPLDDLDRYAELASSVGNLSLAIDLMAQACVTVLWRDDEGDTDLGVQLDWRLWELLAWPLPPGVELVELTGRELIEALFGGNALAVGAHIGDLVEWMQNPGGDEPGESSGATS